MTPNYDYYTYSGLLNYLATNYPNSGYSDYLLTMNNSISIKQMIEIYNKIYGVIRELAGSYSRWEFELNLCFNENLERVYRSMKNPSDEYCYTCLSNLRRANNTRRIIDEISRLQGSHTAQIVKEISTALMIINDATLEIRVIKSENFTTLRINTVLKYYESLHLLEKYGFMISDAEKRLIEEHYMGQLLSSIAHDTLDNDDKSKSFELYYRIREERQKANTKYNFKWWQWCIIFVFIILFCIVGTWLMDSIGGVVGLMVLIGIPGALIGFIRKG